MGSSKLERAAIWLAVVYGLSALTLNVKANRAIARNLSEVDASADHLASIASELNNIYTMGISVNR